MCLTDHICLFRSESLSVEKIMCLIEYEKWKFQMLYVVVIYDFAYFFVFGNNQDIVLSIGKGQVYFIWFIDATMRIENLEKAKSMKLILVLPMSQTQIVLPITYGRYCLGVTVVMGYTNIVRHFLDRRVKSGYQPFW